MARKIRKEMAPKVMPRPRAMLLSRPCDDRLVAEPLFGGDEGLIDGEGGDEVTASTCVILKIGQWWLTSRNSRLT